LRDKQGKLWNSQEQLGQKALLLLLPSTLLAKQSRQSAATRSAIARAIEQLKAKEVAAAVVTASPTQDWWQTCGFLVLRPNDQRASPGSAGHRSQSQTDPRLRALFNTVPSASTLVAVDKAGFVRWVETVRGLPALTPALLQAARSLPQPQQPGLREGQVAPDFSMTDLHGRLRRLADLRGRKNLLLTFFPRCFTGNCTQQVVSLQRELPSLAASGTEVWAVSVDPAAGPKGQRAFVKQWGLRFPLIPDEGRNLSILYGAANSPNQMASRMSVLIDKQGMVRWIDKQINVKTHGQDVLARLRALRLNTSNLNTSKKPKPLDGHGPPQSQSPSHHSPLE
jgi:peroxiredoxin Q/BCP